MRIHRFAAAAAALLVAIPVSASAIAAGGATKASQPAMKSATPVGTAPAGSDTKPAPAPAVAVKPAAEPATEKAIFAGGCFWCEESAFTDLPGVVSVVSGYTGGTKVNPTYEEVSSGMTGHAESVEITYDPKTISYAQLLDVFWHNTDPTQSNGQFCDIGSQYRSEIFYTTPEQKRLAEESKQKLMSTPQRFKGKIVTQIVAATAFYAAEDYHQHFCRVNPGHYQAYREGCERDKRLIQLWGKPGRQGELESAAAH
jgi:peptide-methionine (S)-S-oxide reductase